MKKYDAIVIGTGQSGPSLAARLTQEGLKTAIIERALFGGTCVNVGCVPTKTLVANARAAHIVRHAADFGVGVGTEVTVDMHHVKARKDAVVQQSNIGVTKWLEGLKNLDVYRGHARFKGPHTVRVNSELLEAERIFINTGGRAFVPNMPGIDHVPYLTNSGMMDVDFLPEHLVIVGGSYIGLEFAQMYRRFGSRVTLVEKGPRLIAREDDDVSDAVKKILEAEGIKFQLDAECIALEKHGDGVGIRVNCQDGPPEIIGSHLLIAVGRAPNTNDLGLDQAGIKIDARGFITVDDALRTNVPGVWAMGDVNGRGAFTHTSYNDYEIIAANLFDGERRRATDRITTYALFIDPPLGRCGINEREARASGRPALMAKLPMTRVGRARERGETQGFMKILVDAPTQKILGAAILGIEGDEVTQTVLSVMSANLPYTRISRTMYIHPTVTEMLPTLLEGLKPLP